MESIRMTKLHNTVFH